MIKNNWNEQKSLNCYVRIFQKKKMHENAWNMWLSWKRKGVKDLPMLKDKNLEENYGRKCQKILRMDWSKREREKSFWKGLKKWRTCEKDLCKTLSFQILIGRNWVLIDRKIDSIDRESIEHRLSQADSNQNFNHNFDRSSNSFDRSKI